MFLNVKFETLTYLAGDFSASAPLRLGRSEGPEAALCEECCACAEEGHEMPRLFLCFWQMLRARIMAYVSALTTYRPGATVTLHYGDPDGPTVEVTLNRAIRRRIAFLYRRGRVGTDSSWAEAESAYTHSNARFMARFLWWKHYNIRKAFGRARLGLGSRAVMVNAAALQRGLKDMVSRLTCAAPLSPD